MKVENLIILEGDKTEIDKGAIKYNPTYKETEKTDFKSEKLEPLRARIRTDQFYEEGIVNFKFKAETKETGILLSWLDRANIGLSFGMKSFCVRDLVSRSLASQGSLNQFKKNEEIRMRIEIFGSYGKVYVNDILMCESNINIPKSQLTFLITSTGKVNIYDIEIESHKPKAFVVMQFSEEYNLLYSEVIKPVTESAGYECVRGDEFYASTPILNDIIKSIRDSKVIIAEITPNNPNVFYEIGYAHAINKPTILICDSKREKLPFDISSFRTLFYENSIAGKTKVEESLEKYLENIE